MSTATRVDPAVARHERHLELLGRIRDGAWLDAQTFPPLRWAVPDVVPEGFGLLVGAPKIGKSWLVLGLALAVACGGRALGKIPVGEPRPVLYIALEDGERRLQDRARSLLAGEPIPENLHYVTRATPTDVVLLIEAFLDLHRDTCPLVILDTLGRVMPPALPGEGAYQRDYRVGAGLKSLVDDHRGATLLVVHHRRKQGSEDWMDSTSGTNGLNGAADFTVAISRTRGERDGLLQVTGRDVPEAEYAITASEGTWTLKGDDLGQAAKSAVIARTTAGLGDRSADVAELVNNSPAGLRAADVAHALAVDAKDAADYLVRLHKSGRVARIARGLYGPRMGDLIPFPRTPSESVESVESESGDHPQFDTFAGGAKEGTPAVTSQFDTLDGFDTDGEGDR